MEMRAESQEWLSFNKSVGTGDHGNKLDEGRSKRKEKPGGYWVMGKVNEQEDVNKSNEFRKWVLLCWGLEGSGEMVQEWDIRNWNFKVVMISSGGTS